MNSQEMPISRELAVFELFINNTFFLGLKLLKRRVLFFLETFGSCVHRRMIEA